MSRKDRVASRRSAADESASSGNYFRRDPWYRRLLRRVSKRAWKLEVEAESSDRHASAPRKVPSFDEIRKELHERWGPLLQKLAEDD